MAFEQFNKHGHPGKYYSRIFTTSSEINTKRKSLFTKKRLINIL